MRIRYSIVSQYRYAARMSALAGTPHVDRRRALLEPVQASWPGLYVHTAHDVVAGHEKAVGIGQRVLGLGLPARLHDERGEANGAGTQLQTTSTNVRAAGRIPMRMQVRSS